jgi:pilus assembly protein CpaB
MNIRRVVSLGAALLLSAGAVVATQHWMQGEVGRASATARAQASAKPAALRVLVAAQTLPAGSILRAGQLRWQAWPADASTAGYLTSANARPEQFTGAVVRSDLAAGEPLNATRIVQSGDRSFLAAVLKPGYRAVTLNVSASTGVAGFIFPGDRVDVIFSRAGDGAGPQRHVTSETLLADVRVVGADQRIANAKKDVVVPQTATLEVTPRQAEGLAAASEMGKLSLSLRSLAEPTTPVEAAEPVRPTPVALPPSAPRRSHVRSALAVQAVEIVRGGQGSIQGAVQ